jgi:hypothetical protein
MSLKDPPVNILWKYYVRMKHGGVAESYLRRAAALSIFSEPRLHEGGRVERQLWVESGHPTEDKFKVASVSYRSIADVSPRSRAQIKRDVVR